MMDIIFIRELALDTVIGIHAWERQVRQTLLLDLEMATSIAKAAETDDIRQTLNYQAISERLCEFAAEHQFLLIERMAEEIAQVILEEFSVPWVRLTLSKPTALPGTQSVGVMIERGEPR